MARIAGVDLPREKRAEIGLTYIYGIGDQLMQAILTYARERDDIYTVVSVITGDNEKSIRMHKKYGFEDCGRLKEVGMKFGRRLDVVNLQLFV